MANEYTYKVEMTCGGCSGAVTRILDRQRGAGAVDDFKVDLDAQKVWVKTSTLDSDAVQKLLEKSGKKVEVFSA